MFGLGGNWTRSTLYLHLLALLEEREKRFEERALALERTMQAGLAAGVEAVEKVEQASEKAIDKA